MSFSCKVGRFFNISAAVLAVGIGIFHIMNVSGIILMSAMTIRVLHLTAMLTIAFLLYPKNKDTISLCDYVIKFTGIVASILTGAYVLIRWQSIIESGGAANEVDTIIGIAMVLLILLATYKTLGKSLTFITLVFVLYPFFGPFMPGILQSRAYSVSRVFNFLYTTTQGIYGIPIGVSSSYIILFCIYGAFLSQFGAGDFMFKLASSFTSNLVAATAKTAIVFSTLVGMISGSAAGNVAVTGSLTIPMMKRKGYKAHIAAAIEAIASTGGQIMPPIMGAAAFIMAELIGQPYTSIMRAAIIPALLYFLTIYIIVHLTALKGNIDLAEENAEKEPSFKIISEGWYFILPIIVLILMMVIGFSPFKAAYYSTISLLAVYIIAKRDFSRELLIKIVSSIKKGVYDTIPIAIACAASGVIMGTIALTGVGSRLSNLIITISNGELIIALVLTMITSIILGMGLPTTAAYLILASVVAPALVKMGLPILTAHMFVFFYGCISTITPPVALASYVAAGIAGANANEVGWTAFKFGLVSFILPYMFAFGPSLLLEGSAVQIITTIIVSVIGIFAIAASIVGYYKIKLSGLYRVLLFLTGILLVNQGFVTDLIGLGTLALILLKIHRKSYKRSEVK
ncbi:MAG: TRAP transporter fused permease subunit [Firmicutes bacterium]|nr:TRAP transporter fused permease subunit [Bacillota bacterium]